MGNGAPLYDAEVEYIESTGHQRIDTGVTESSGLFSADLLLKSDGTDPFMGFFGKSASDAGTPFYKHRILCYYHRGNNRYILEDGTTEHTLGASANFNLQVTNYAWKVVPRTPSGTVDRHFLLFSPTGTYAGHMRFHSFAIADSTGTTLRDFQPVRIGTEGCLYDKVTKSLFRNTGSEDFILGPDKT